MDREEMVRTEAQCKVWLDNEIQKMDNLTDVFRNSYTGYSRYTPLLVLYCIFWGLVGAGLCIMSPWLGRWIARICNVGKVEGDKLAIILFIISLYGIAAVVLLNIIQMATRVYRIRKIDAYVRNVLAIKKDLLKKSSIVEETLEDIGQLVGMVDLEIHDFGKMIGEIEAIETIARKYKQEDSWLLKEVIDVLYWGTLIFFEIMLLLMTTKTVAGIVQLELVDMNWKWGAAVGKTGYSFLYVLVIGVVTVGLYYLWKRIEKCNILTYVASITVMLLLIPISFVLMPAIVYLFLWGIVGAILYGIYRGIKKFL